MQKLFHLCLNKWANIVARSFFGSFRAWSLCNFTKRFKQQKKPSCCWGTRESLNGGNNTALKNIVPRCLSRYQFYCKLQVVDICIETAIRHFHLYAMHVKFVLLHLIEHFLWLIMINFFFFIINNHFGHVRLHYNT